MLLLFFHLKIDILVSSSRKRAYATALAINKYHNLPIIINDAVIEINAGEWEGQKFEKFSEMYPEEIKIWNNEPHNFIAPKGEKMADVYERMVGFVKKLAEENDGKTIVIASHGCAIRNLMCWVKGLDFSRLNEVCFSGNTAINIFEVNAGEPKLIIENDYSHLPYELAKISSQKWTEEETE